MSKMKIETLPKLYEFSICPFCLKVKNMLLYKGVRHEDIEVNPISKKELKFSKDYKKVPIYVDAQGRQINDSTEIMHYIDELYPDKPVFETEPAKQSSEAQWLKWSDEKLVRGLTPLIYENFSSSLEAFKYISKSSKFSKWQKGLIRYFGAVAMWRVGKKRAKEQGIENPRKNLLNLLEQWSQGLGKKPYMGEVKPNGADFAVFGILKSLDNLPGHDCIKQVPNTYAWFRRMENLISKQGV